MLISTHVLTHVLTQLDPGPATVSMRAHPHMAVTAIYLHTVCDSLRHPAVNHASCGPRSYESAVIAPNDSNLCSVFFNMGLA